MMLSEYKSDMKKESGVKDKSVFLAYFLNQTFQGENSFNRFLFIICVFSNIKCDEYRSLNCIRSSREPDTN